MLNRLHDYIVAVVAATVALLSLLGVALSLTVWKPAQEIVASVSSEHPLVMTREGVLPLFDDEVIVTATAGATDNVTVVAGSAADVLGWIGDAPYTEIVGIESGFTQLKYQTHGVQSPQSGVQPQSGGHPQSAQAPQSTPAQAPQSGDASQSGATLSDELAANDMWLNTATGVGEAHLRLSDLKGSVSILATTSHKNPVLTLTWSVRSTNVMLLIFGVIAALFTALAVFSFIRQWMLERSRVERAAQLETRSTADITDTATFSLEQLEQYAAEQEALAAQAKDNEEPPTFVEDEPATSAVEQTVSVSPSHAARDLQPRKLTLTGVQPLDTTAVSEQEAAPTEEAASAEEAAAPESNEIPVAGGGDTQEAAETEQTAVKTEPETGGASEELVNARHRAENTYGDEDPPETVPTDTGTIDLTAIRPGAVLPSRRALREARERGETSVMIEGQEFDTGLIPRITRVDAEEIKKLTDTDESAPAHVEEYIYDSSLPDTPVDDAPQGASAEGGWTSMMSTWLKGRKTEGDIK